MYNNQANNVPQQETGEAALSVLQDILAECSRLRVENMQLKKTLTAYEQKINLAKIALTQLKNKYEELTIEHSELQANQATYEQDRAAYDQKLSNLNDKYMALQTEKDQYIKLYQKNKDQIEKLKSKYDDLLAKHGTLTYDFANMKNEFKKAQEQLNEQEQEQVKNNSNSDDMNQKLLNDTQYPNKAASTKQFCNLV